MRLMAEQLTTLRRERLRKLYNAEMEEWEERLAALGLAVERPVV